MSKAAVEAIGRYGVSINGERDVDAAMRAIGEARMVLLGEATHGTREFYRFRSELTKRLIAEKGFHAIAVEADWPAALRASQYAKGQGNDADPIAALGGFERFPRWMWRNTDVVDLIGWLRNHNDTLTAHRAKVGFYGLDLYSLRESMYEVMDYLDQTDPDAAARARERYACFDGLAHDPQLYGHAVNFGLRSDCEREVVAQLIDMLNKVNRTLHLDTGTPDADALFYAQQNARVVRDAEHYYRSMFSGHVASWNVRDQHMAATMQQLHAYLSSLHGEPARIVAWAHNSHIGDARATEAHDSGELNLGQLVRERQDLLGPAFLLGFTTHAGTVAAASDWDADVELKRVLPSRQDSIERILHHGAADAGMAGFVLPLSPQAGGTPELAKTLATPRLERAIGVIYRPETERWSHYFQAAIADQFDAIVHIDHTHAVKPLEHEHPWEHTTEPEAWPSGI